MKDELLDGKFVFFVREREHGRFGEWCCIGNCNADDHWQALDKFERGLGMARPFERGKRYKIYKDCGKLGRKVLISFIY